MPTPAESGFRHGRSTMPKLRVGMPPTICNLRSLCGFYDTIGLIFRVREISLPQPPVPKTFVGVAVGDLSCRGAPVFR